ncbi:MAG: LysM peptidoglycan-binding domain-containing protein [Muribaculum sp.]|nr:LysM peptidoglycan-binding domain-containing protein [Muribaculum sp.]
MKRQAMIASLLALALLAAPLGNMGPMAAVDAEEGPAEGTYSATDIASVTGNASELESYTDRTPVDTPTNVRWESISGENGDKANRYTRYAMYWDGVNPSTYDIGYGNISSCWVFEIDKDGRPYLNWETPMTIGDFYYTDSYYNGYMDWEHRVFVTDNTIRTQHHTTFADHYLFESGNYRFRVRAKTEQYQGDTYQDSEWSEWSESIHYIRPEQELFGSVAGYWDAQKTGLGHFTNFAKSPYLYHYEINLYKFYDNEYGEGWSQCARVRHSNGLDAEVINIDFSDIISWSGAGKYYFTVQAYSNDIDVVAHGKESPASDILDTSINAEKLHDILDSAEGKTSTEKVELLRDSADISSIQQAMQTDDAFRGQIQALESQYAAEQNITALPPAISDAVKNSGVNPDKVSVVGAAFNAAQGKEINLQMDMTPPENRIPVYSRYRKNVQLDIRLVSDNAEIHELAMPVSVTMPIPEGINADQLLILHYRADGSTEKTAFHVNGDGTVTFTVKSFSTFVFAEEGSADAPDDPEPSPAPGEDKPAPGGNNPAPASSLALDSQIAAAAPNSTVKVTKAQNINTLSHDIMQLLVKRGDVTLDMEYEYDGTDYHIIISAGKAVDNDIPWYGPLYLSAYFSAGDAADGYTYTVQKGDTLGRIARSHHTTVARLSAANPQIKNVDRIVPGQIINIQ